MNSDNPRVPRDRPALAPPNGGSSVHRPGKELSVTVSITDTDAHKATCEALAIAFSYLTDEQKAEALKPLAAFGFKFGSSEHEAYGNDCPNGACDV